MYAKCDFVQVSDAGKTNEGANLPPIVRRDAMIDASVFNNGSGDDDLRINHSIRNGGASL